jgi:hypothetical protein
MSKSLRSDGAMIGADQEGSTMNGILETLDRHARAALQSVARAALHAARNPVAKKLSGKNIMDLVATSPVTIASPPQPEEHKIKNPHSWYDDRAVDWMVTRGATAPMTIADATALTQVRLHFLPSLVPVSAAAAILDQSLKFSFEDHAASISVPGVSLPTAGFVGEDQAIPVLEGTSTGNAPMTPSKLAAIIVITREMVEGADAENVMMQVLKENIGVSLDAAFFNSNAAVATVSPAGILNGAIVVPPAAAGAGAMVQDIGSLKQALGAVSGSGRPVIVGAPKQIAAIEADYINPPPYYESKALAEGTVVAIVPAAVASANGTPTITASLEATLHSADPAADLVASPSTVAAPQRSIFQSDSLAVRFTMDLSWTTRGAGVAMITGAAWP